MIDIKPGERIRVESTNGGSIIGTLAQPFRVGNPIILGNGAHIDSHAVENIERLAPKTEEDVAREVGDIATRLFMIGIHVTGEDEFSIMAKDRIMKAIELLDNVITGKSEPSEGTR